MVLSKDQLEILSKMLLLTQSQELTCDECLKHMAEFAENAIADQSVPEDLKAVEHHLALCGECEEEFRALLAALQSEK